MTMQHNALNLLAIFTASLAVLACGVKSSPQQPEGAVFSQQYPAALPQLVVTEPVINQMQQRSLAPAVQPGAVYPNTTRPAGS